MYSELPHLSVRIADSKSCQIWSTFLFPGLSDTLSRGIVKQKETHGWFIWLDICAFHVQGSEGRRALSAADWRLDLSRQWHVHLRAYGPNPETQPEIANECLCTISPAKTEIHALFTHKNTTTLTVSHFVSQSCPYQHQHMTHTVLSFNAQDESLWRRRAITYHSTFNKDWEVIAVC